MASSILNACIHESKTHLLEKSHAQSSTRPTYRRMARSTNLNVSISAAGGQCQTTKRQYKMTIP
ncbi:hypothetical protein HID58_070662 [Brassica napus]|uniref:Uncharacterized protein n=1 Tax=Brassica napus TaxID=3708 RepID=A0ABQ7YZG7_BRANA|nr:hypothetical protein HID58_070662 [Brassica napus]